MVIVMAPRQNPIDSLAEATNIRLERLETAVKETSSSIQQQNQDLSQAI